MSDTCSCLSLKLVRYCFRKSTCDVCTCKGKEAQCYTPTKCHKLQQGEQRELVCFQMPKASKESQNASLEIVNKVSVIRQQGIVVE